MSTRPYSEAELQEWIAQEWAQTSCWLKAVIAGESHVKWPQSTIAAKGKKLKMLQQISKRLANDG